MTAGRKTDYRVKYNKEVYKLCLLGLKDVEIAEFFEVSERTLNRWKKEHPKFRQSMQKGKKIADMKGIVKFYDRVTGYDYEEKHETIEQVYVDGEAVEGTEKKVIKKMKKHVSPDVTAGKFWFINRTRHNENPFCERVDNTHSSPDGGPIQTITRVIVDPKEDK